MKFTAKFIDEALQNKYLKSAKYMISNIYAFAHAYGETDFMVVNSSGYIYDIEIKVSRADFKADFKKVKKHSILELGGYTNAWTSFTRDPSAKKNKWKKVPKYKEIKVTNRPNRFYFAVPDGLLTAEEVPTYAGLIYVDEHGAVRKIKEAKLLHKKKLNVEKLLCRKFYFYWKNAENKLKIWKSQLK